MKRRRSKKATAGTPRELYAVAQVVGCFGIKGYLKVQLSTSHADRLKRLQKVYVGALASAATGASVEDVIVRPRSILVKLGGINDRTSAELYKGAFLFIGEEELAVPEKGSYFIHDIIGCLVLTTDGGSLGTVEDVYKLPAQDVWAVRTGEKLLMIPAVHEFIEKVDLRRRIVTVRLMDGLTEE